MTDDPRLVAVVSGATGTIGGAIAQRLAQEGWRVFGLTTQAHPPRPDETRTDGYVSLHTCRVEKVHDVREVRQYVGMKAGPPRLLVVAHGAAPVPVPTTALAPKQFKMVQDIDVNGTMHLCQAFGAMMVKQHRGSIILITSIHQFGAFPARLAYAAAKNAVAGMGRELAVEWAPYNVQVNMIAPGQVDGPRTRQIASAEDITLMQARTPAGKLVMPADVAAGVMALLHLPAVTGTTLTIDHGWTSSIAYKPHRESP